ncbi:MAG: response regulator [Lachnospiraceae bacterium]|nr:response regulator [Lachnospiraceae bacterium]
MSHILLVDDDEDMLALTGRWLEKAGYRVSKAPSGKEALALIEEEKPDLVLLDYAMPDMNGPEVLKEIRLRDESQKITVLFRTGLDDPDAANQEGEYRADGIVSKSEGKPGLMKAVAAALG